MSAAPNQLQPEGARDAEQRLALWVIHNPDAAAVRIEELTKGVLRIIETWHCGDIKPEDIAQLRSLFDSAPSVPLERLGDAT